MGSFYPRTTTRVECIHHYEKWRAEGIRNIPRFNRNKQGDWNGVSQERKKAAGSAACAVVGLCFFEEIGLGRDLGEEIRAYLKDTRQTLAGGIAEIACLVAEGQFACGLAVFAGRDKFRGGRQQPIGGQRRGLFHDTFFGRKIRDPTDKEICRFLADLLGGLVFKQPLAGLIDQDILMISRFHRQHGNVGGVEAEQPFVLEM